MRLARASFILATLAVLWPVRSDAYRPFDQTDADVAGPKEFEFELGPVIFQHGPRGNAWAPSFVLNLGLVRDLELVVDGNGFVRLGPLPMDAERWVATSALQVKFVVREGSLQDASGPSIALDETRGFLFVGCDEGKAVALDVAHDGKVLGTATSGNGVDIIAYAPGLKHLYLPGGDSATMAILSVADSGALKVLRTVPTAADAHCVAADATGGVYVCDPKQGRLLVFKDDAGQ